jgi:hypothetical protein
MLTSVKEGYKDVQCTVAFKLEEGNYFSKIYIIFLCFQSAFSIGGNLGGEDEEGKVDNQVPWHYDIQHNDTQHNGTQHNNKK